MGHHLPPQGHGAGSGVLEALLPGFVPLSAAGVYVLLAHRARRRNPALGWSRWRTTSFLTGTGLLGVALLPPLATFAKGDFRGHMAQHLLIGMYAPLALTLAAPVTLLLRTLPATQGRRLTAVLHTRPVRGITHPAVALALSTGSLAMLYFTPLYNAVMSKPPTHWLLHTHFLLSGCLFAYVIAGPDPAPSRPGVRARLVYLGAAITAHAVFSQMLYGGFWVDIHAPIEQVQGSAEIMYYGGDIAELLLAAALVTSWRPDQRRSTTRGAITSPTTSTPARRQAHGDQAPLA
jgi:putative membrane protein